LMTDVNDPHQLLQDVVLGTLDAKPAATVRDAIRNWEAWVGRAATDQEIARITTIHRDSPRAAPPPSHMTTASSDATPLNRMMRWLVIGGALLVLIAGVLYVESQSGKGYASQDAKLLYFVAPMFLIPPVIVAGPIIALRDLRRLVPGLLSVGGIAVLAFAVLVMIAVPLQQHPVAGAGLLGLVGIGSALLAGLCLGELTPRTWIGILTGGLVTMLVGGYNPQLGMAAILVPVVAALVLINLHPGSDAAPAR
jgi:hypothetical protein